ncbi:MAG TPA: NrfD/PsrC family molybdoenzyme membrane anchor subunit [Terriglobales bacterium]|nr:NrfD/PsrC family molybdoenzyme membrane anchor subunit [Terriglobales bacterium]
MSTDAVPQDPTPQRASEARLLQLRREAETRGKVQAIGVRPPGAPFPKASPQSGYYGMPMLKQPQWKWEVPLYFFVGGAAGSAAVIGAMANWVGRDPELRRNARLVAAAGGLISTGLLVADLGRPARFIAMLRVFKKQSAMSLGAWTLAAFSSFSGATAFAELVSERFDFAPVRVLGHVSEAFSAALGLPFHNYTGVLIGATAIPVWNSNITTLPIHFGMSGLSSAVAILELLGHQNSALNLLGIGASAFETYEGLHLEKRKEEALDPLKHGVSGWITRLGGVFSGPAPLALRLAAQVSGSHKMRRAACWSAIAGSLLTRYGWMQAGHASAKNWRLPLEIPAESPELNQSESKSGLTSKTAKSA